jgi:hypothetical protein
MQTFVEILFGVFPKIRSFQFHLIFFKIHQIPFLSQNHSFLPFFSARVASDDLCECFFFNSLLERE